MVFAAQDGAISQAHPNVSHPAGTGSDRRSPARFSDPQGPGPAAPDGSENPCLYGEGRARAGRNGPLWSPPPVNDAASAFLTAARIRLGHFAGFVLEEIRSRRWSSLTFQGARHELAFRLEGEGAGEAAGRFLSGLDARGFELRGHLLADVSLVAQERRPGFARIRLDALTVEDR